MPYLDRLRNILNPILLHNGNIIPRQSGCADIEFLGDVVLMQSDIQAINDGVLGVLFADVNAGYKKKNDWVVFSENKVLVCEMKTQTLENYQKQLRNGHCLVKYILDKIRINEQVDYPRSNIAIRYVLFSNAADKRTTNGRPKAISNDFGIQWYELACGSIYNINDF